MAATLREILAKANGDTKLKRREFEDFIKRRNSTGGAISLSIQRDFMFPGDGDNKPDEADK